ncbi:MAG: DUF4019 domain-containing protein [Burkholderiaceae bacterium]
MRVFNALFAALAMMIALAFSSAFAQDDPKAGDDFLKLIDAKQYAQSWDVASDYFKQSVSRSDWVSQVRQARQPLGDVVVRSMKKSEPQKNPPGAPPGDYLLLTFDTKFANSESSRT